MSKFVSLLSVVVSESSLDRVFSLLKPGGADGTRTRDRSIMSHSLRDAATRQIASPPDIRPPVVTLSDPQLPGLTLSCPEFVSKTQMRPGVLGICVRSASLLVCASVSSATRATASSSAGGPTRDLAPLCTCHLTRMS